jgi:hypothetical protein
MQIQLSDRLQQQQQRQSSITGSLFVGSDALIPPKKGEKTIKPTNILQQCAPYTVSSYKLCVICVSKEIKTINIPCGHSTYCLICPHLDYKIQITCPICGKKLTHITENL